MEQKLMRDLASQPTQGVRPIPAEPAIPEAESSDQMSAMFDFPLFWSCFILLMPLPVKYSRQHLLHANFFL
ncbi:hypothetical protein J0J24_24550, partial [Vibrio vulnificus]|uniref:hypothetical protein n=1 Tax=Vibrio vulnificus TaxID=672 RepID=UPI0019D4DBDF